MFNRKKTVYEETINGVNFKIKQKKEKTSYNIHYNYENINLEIQKVDNGIAFEVISHHQGRQKVIIPHELFKKIYEEMSN